MLRQCIVWILITYIIPYLLGTGVSYKIEKEYSNSVAFRYVMGFITQLAIFQLLCVPWTFLKLKFHLLVYVYSTIIFIYCLIVAYKIIKAHKTPKLFKLTKPDPVSLVVIILILCQTAIPVFFTTYAGGDDATYVVRALDILYNDNLYLSHPFTGNYQPLFEVSSKMLLTSFVPFTSYLSKISGIHVAIVTHTLIPLWLTPIAYIVYYLLGKLLLPIKSVNFFMLFLCVINIFGGYSNYTLTLRLLVCIWHGKAVMAAIILPFLIFCSIRLFKEKADIKEYALLTITNIAACSVTLMGIGLSLLLIIGLAFVYTRKLVKVKTAFICCMPSVIYTFIYLILKGLSVSI